MTRSGAKWMARMAVVVAAAALAGGAAWAQAGGGVVLGPGQLVATLHQVNQMEITAGQMAQRNGSSTAVKDYGQTLVRDHQAADDQITNYANSKGMPLNDVPAEVQKQLQAARAKLASLQNTSGPAFDQPFALMMARGHAKVIDLVEDARPRITDQGLIVLIDRLVPTLREHRRMAENILNGNAPASTAAQPGGGALPTPVR